MKVYLLTNFKGLSIPTSRMESAWVLSTWRLGIFFLDYNRDFFYLMLMFKTVSQNIVTERTASSSSPSSSSSSSSSSSVNNNITPKIEILSIHFTHLPCLCAASFLKLFFSVYFFLYRHFLQFLVYANAMTAHPVKMDEEWYSALNRTRHPPELRRVFC